LDSGSENSRQLNELQLFFEPPVDNQKKQDIMMTSAVD